MQLAATVTDSCNAYELLVVVHPKYNRDAILKTDRPLFLF
jgi:hypothetical protein